MVYCTAVLYSISIQLVVLAIMAMLHYAMLYIYKIIRLLAFVYLSTPMIYSTCVYM